MFDHENLDVYQLARAVAKWFDATDFPKGAGELKDQGVRATRSVVQNIAEGRSRRPYKSEVYHYRVALASAAEACSVLDCVSLPEA